MIKDSGNRRKFDSGAVRDIQEGKGRCDLLPLDVVAPMFEHRSEALILSYIDEFMQTKQDYNLYLAIEEFIESAQVDIYTAILEVSIHYEEGAKKYGEHNWEKGLPLSCYIDSGIRHMLKYFRGDNDENHFRAFIWNMLGAIWTNKHVKTTTEGTTSTIEHDPVCSSSKITNRTLYTLEI